jgi:hypothetical protein
MDTMLEHALNKILDYIVGFWLYCHQLHHDAMVYTDAGPGLPAVGLCELGHWPFPVPDFRRGGRHTSEENTPKRAFGRAVRPRYADAHAANTRKGLTRSRR